MIMSIIIKEIVSFQILSTSKEKNQEKSIVKVEYTVKNVDSSTNCDYWIVILTPSNYETRER